MALNQEEREAVNRKAMVKARARQRREDATKRWEEIKTQSPSPSLEAPLMFYEMTQGDYDTATDFIDAHRPK